MLPAVAQQGASHIKGRVKAFVQIKGEGIRPLDPGHQMAVRRGNCQHGTDAAINVQPQTLVLTKIGDGGQIVDRAGVGGSGGCDHAGRADARQAIRANAVP